MKRKRSLTGESKCHAWHQLQLYTVQLLENMKVESFVFRQMNLSTHNVSTEVHNACLWVLKSGFGVLVAGKKDGSSIINEFYFNQCHLSKVIFLRTNHKYLDWPLKTDWFKIRRILNFLKSATQTDIFNLRQKVADKGISSIEWCT